MGNCLSNEEELRSRQLDRQMQRDYREEKRVVKLLLLGTGESGKSTIVKQMKILHGTAENGMEIEERTKQKETIMNNLLDSLQALILASQRFGYSVSCGDCQEGLTELLQRREEGQPWTIDKGVAEQVKVLIQDPAILNTINRKSEFQLLDSAMYFLNSVDRIAESNYIPSKEDVLRARSITTGINTVPFQVAKLKFELVDVGGQRSERKKWIHVFDQVTAVMFIIALSEYDQVLYEDASVNRMRESLSLFQQMLSSPFFSSTPFILFLNKQDIFEEKISKSAITPAFPEYQGTQGLEESKTYIKNKFVELNQNKKREVYWYYTTATDTDLVNNVFNSVKDIILNKVLAQQGFT